MAKRGKRDDYHQKIETLLAMGGVQKNNSWVKCFAYSMALLIYLSVGNSFWLPSIFMP
jgi:hypothetical protein